MCDSPWHLTHINAKTLGHAPVFPCHAEEAPLERIHITQHTSLGAVWFAGWLFTIGYLKLDFLLGLLGLVVWPYFLGSHFTPA